MLRAITLLCLTAPAMAGTFRPATFEPRIAQDGSRTWRIEIDESDLRYLRAEDKALPASKRNEVIAASFLGKERFCRYGWQITNSRTEKKRLIIEGRCVAESVTTGEDTQGK